MTTTVTCGRLDTHPAHEWIRRTLTDGYRLPWNVVITDCPGAPTYGLCTGCGSVEVALVNATGVRDLSGIGESHTYPTGYGCEVCA